MNFTKSYVKTPYENNPATSIAHHLSYMMTPDTNLISMLRSKGFDINGGQYFQGDLQQAIIDYMAQSEDNVREILCYHPHYKIFEEVFQEQPQQTTYSFKPVFEKRPQPIYQKSLFTMELNGLSILVLLVFTFLVLKVAKAI